MACEQVEMLRSQVEIYENSIKTIQTAQTIDKLLNKQHPIPFFKVYEDLIVMENAASISGACRIIRLKEGVESVIS